MDGVHTNRHGVVWGGSTMHDARARAVVSVGASDPARARGIVDDAREPAGRPAARRSGVLGGREGRGRYARGSLGGRSPQTSVDDRAGGGIVLGVADGPSEMPVRLGLGLGLDDLPMPAALPLPPSNSLSGTGSGTLADPRPSIQPFSQDSRHPSRVPPMLSSSEPRVDPCEHARR